MEKYQTQVLTLRTERNEVRTKKTKVRYFNTQTEQARFILVFVYLIFILTFLLPVIYPMPTSTETIGNIRQFSETSEVFKNCFLCIFENFLQIFGKFR